MMIPFIKNIEKVGEKMFKEGRKVKTLLFNLDLTQVWLIGKLGERGILTDKSEMSSVLSGARRGNKADLIIQNSLEILNDVEKRLINHS